MGKKVLIIGGSPRKDGNSAALCEQFAKGASEAGNQVEYISLSGKKIGFCTACYACEGGECPQKDDVPGIIAKMLDADVIVLATPVYFYTMSAQLIDIALRRIHRFRKADFHFRMYFIDATTANAIMGIVFQQALPKIVQHFAVVRQAVAVHNRRHRLCNRFQQIICVIVLPF